MKDVDAAELLKCWILQVVVDVMMDTIQSLRVATADGVRTSNAAVVPASEEMMVAE